MDTPARLAAWRTAAADLEVDALVDLILDLDERGLAAAHEHHLPVQSAGEIPMLIVYLHDQLADRAGEEAVTRATHLSRGLQLSADLRTQAAALAATSARFAALGESIEQALLTLAAGLTQRLTLRVTRDELPALSPAEALVIEAEPPRLRIELVQADGHRLRLMVAPHKRRTTRTVRGLFGTREEAIEVVEPHATAERWLGENCLEDHLPVPGLAVATGEALRLHPHEPETQKSLELLRVQLALPELVRQAVALRQATLQAALARVGG